MSRRMVRGRRAPPVRPGFWALLNDEPFPANASVWEKLLFDRFAETLWHEHGEAITAAWAEAHPGTRPSCWWRFSSPTRAITPKPPSAETQADFLRRHGLLLPGEARRIPKAKPRSRMRPITQGASQNEQ